MGHIFVREVVTQLPTSMLLRYRAVDRDVGSNLVDTPKHLDALTEDIRFHGIRVPLRFGFNHEFATLDGNHRIAAALRLGLDKVPVTLVKEPTSPRPAHAQPMRPDDLAEIKRALDATDSARTRRQIRLGYARGGCAYSSRDVLHPIRAGIPLVVLAAVLVHPSPHVHHVEIMC